MIRATTIDLINESPEAHGVFEAHAETKTTVFAEIRSVSNSEFYRAKEADIEPAYIFRLTDYADYGGQKLIEWSGKRYRVVRTYTKSQSIEITVEEATNDR